MQSEYLLKILVNDSTRVYIVNVNKMKRLDLTEITIYAIEHKRYR